MAFTLSVCQADYASGADQHSLLEGVRLATMPVSVETAMMRGSAQDRLDRGRRHASQQPAQSRDLRLDQPDIVLLDIQLPGLDGFAVADHLATRIPAPTVVLTSSRDAVTYGGRVVRAPVAGFIPERELSGASLAGLLE